MTQEDKKRRFLINISLYDIDKMKYIFNTNGMQNIDSIEKAREIIRSLLVELVDHI